MTGQAPRCSPWVQIGQISTFFSTENPRSDSDFGALAKIRPRLGAAAGPGGARAGLRPGRTPPRGLSPPVAANKSAFGLQGAPRAPVWPAGQTGLQAGLACRPDWPEGQTGRQAGLACRPDWPAGRTGLQAGLACRPDSIHRRHTCIRLLDRNPTMSQKSNYSTEIQLCHKKTTMSQKLNYSTETQLCHKKTNYSTETQLSHRHPMSVQTPNVSPDPRCQGRAPMSG